MPVAVKLSPNKHISYLQDARMPIGCEEDQSADAERAPYYIHQEDK